MSDYYITHPGERLNTETRLKLIDPANYIPSKELENAVSISLQLAKPLLVTGEPGTGKTHLAHSVSHHLGLGAPLVFNTRTTSTAKDLFYNYNALAHFHYSQNSLNKNIDPDEVENRFISYQAMGQAIRSQKQHVVLIDEIDKAPRDLPNDILNVMEDLSFYVPEIDKTYKATEEARPIVILTSNSEKNLPDAFLRRCTFHHIKFPDEGQLLDIIKNRVVPYYYKEEQLKDLVIPTFLKIRNAIKGKKPGTADLIYWLLVLESIPVKPELLMKILIPNQGLDKEEINLVDRSLYVITKTVEDHQDVLALLSIG